MTSKIPNANASKALLAIWVFWCSSVLLLGFSQVLGFSLTQGQGETEINLSLLFSGLLFWAVKASPLLAAFLPLRKRSHRAATWLAYACLFYFLIWMLVCFTPNRSELGTLGLAATTGLFISCLLFTRWEKRLIALNHTD
jgi:uncharacterized membrane protein